jgi:hypothetical protein
MGLQDQLDQLLAKAATVIPAETANIMAAAMEKLKQSGISDTALKTGDKAPGFELFNTKGTSLSSTALLKKGPLVISFYRGSW